MDFFVQKTKFSCILSADKKVVRGSNVPVLTSHAGLNPRSKHASFSLTVSLAALRTGYEPERRVIIFNLALTPAKPGSYHIYSGSESASLGYQEKSYMPLGEIRAVFLPVEYVSAFVTDIHVGRKIAVS